MPKQAVKEFPHVVPLTEAAGFADDTDFDAINHDIDVAEGVKKLRNSDDLTDEEKVVMTGLYGLGGKQLSMDQIAHQMGIPREQVRRIDENMRGKAVHVLNGDYDNRRYHRKIAA